MNTCARSIPLLSSRTSSLLHLSDAKTNGVRDFCIILWISCTLPDCAHLPSRGQPWAESSNLCGFDQDSDMEIASINFILHQFHHLQEHLGKWWTCTEKWWKAFWVATQWLSIRLHMQQKKNLMAGREFLASGRYPLLRNWHAFQTVLDQYFNLESNKVWAILCASTLPHWQFSTKDELWNNLYLSVSCKKLELHDLLFISIFILCLVRLPGKHKEPTENKHKTMLF